MALLLALTACSEQPPPPYLVFFADSVPDADRDGWGAAAADWNAAMGGLGEHVFMVGAEPANGRCGVEIVQVEHRPANSPAASFNGHCLMRVEYQRGALEACVALHELGHRLLEDHVRGTVFDAYGCDFEPVVTPGLAQRVRERWGLKAR